MRSDSIPMTQPMYKLHHKLLNANVLKTVSSPLLLIDTYTQQNFMPTQSGKKIDLFYTCDRFIKMILYLVQEDYLVQSKIYIDLSGGNFFLTIIYHKNSYHFLYIFPWLYRNNKYEILDSSTGLLG